jgi:hypothetical protein
MQDRLSAVQQTLLWLLAAALGVALLSRPYPANRRYMQALDEVSGFRDGFEQATVEKSLLEHAQSQGQQPLALVQRSAAAAGVTLQLSATAPPLQPMAAVQLATLEQVKARGEPAGTIKIGVASAEAIGAALAWRLAELGNAKPGPFTLTAVALAPAAVSDADIARERQVMSLRGDVSATQAAALETGKKLTAADLQLEQQRKWKLPWKVLAKTDERRKAARAENARAENAAKAAKQRYEGEAKRARSEKSAAPAVTPEAIPTFAIARASVDAGAEHLTLELPVALQLRDVPVPPLPSTRFAATFSAGLWDEVKHLDAERAVAAIRAHFNWHYRYIERLGLKIGGMTVLQLLPCILPLLLALLLARVRAVAISYNPFHTKVRGVMPRVGFKSRVLDAVVLVVLPFGAGACAAAALLMIGQVPALPVLAAVACLLLGGYAFTKLGDLQNLVEDVVRSHSNPPPDPDDSSM